jgi:hypothetical protein
MAIAAVAAGLLQYFSTIACPGEGCECRTKSYEIRVVIYCQSWLMAGVLSVRYSTTVQSYMSMSWRWVQVQEQVQDQELRD